MMNESVHLPHLEGPADVVPPHISRRSAFYRDLARFASLTDSGRVRRTPIQCRKRPGRKQCRGLLDVRRRDLPPAVEWECPECSAGGRITGWEDTDADLRRLGLAPHAADLVVAISVRAHAALRDVARTDDELIPLAYGAEVDGAAQPVLRVSDADGMRHAGTLLRLSLTVASDRCRGLLLEVLEALSRATNAQDPTSSGFLTFDSPIGEQFAAALLGLPDAAPPQIIPARPRPRPRSTRRRQAESMTFQIKVTLRDVKPPVWRRLIVPSDISLPALHGVLQAAMGWYDCHLHLFRVGHRAFAPPGDWEPVGQDSRGVSLADLAPGKGKRVIYEYDFGDDWCHDILVEDVINGACTSARCLKGRRRCPPEDCGGPWGYAQLREALADPAHERHDELSEWLSGDFDPEEFDVIYTDAVVREVRI